MLESKYQRELTKEIEKRLPGCLVLKNDSSLRQGIPDLTVLYKDRWAALEVKSSQTAAEQPNQEYYISQMDEMSYAAFIYPENETEVLDALQHALRG